MLTLDDSPPRMPVPALGQMILEHRRGGLLYLEEQRVVTVAALE